MVYHCFFEQSGTFKNEFKKLGYEAYDYDILNDFGETDYIIDLFEEIEKEYSKESSIFDSLHKERDVILAFFPCIRFTDQIINWFKGQSPGQKKWNDEQKLEYDLKLHDELHYLYRLITKLTIVCIRKGIPLIIENPYNGTHYLKYYWSLQPSIIDKDRYENGDYYSKPTQYWFINCEPKHNLVFEPLEYVEKKDIKHQCGENGINRVVMRSMIHPQYARRFIKEFIIESENTKNEVS